MPQANRTSGSAYPDETMSLPTGRSTPRALSRREPLLDLDDVVGFPGLIEERSRRTTARSGGSGGPSVAHHRLSRRSRNTVVSPGSRADFSGESVAPLIRRLRRAKIMPLHSAAVGDDAVAVTATLAWLSTTRDGRICGFSRRPSEVPRRGYGETSRRRSRWTYEGAERQQTSPAYNPFDIKFKLIYL
jgi:hypothetical protein